MSLALGYKGLKLCGHYCGQDFSPIKLRTNKLTFVFMGYMCYNISMKDNRPGFKLWAHTLPKLRLLYALSGESMVSIVDRLVTQELERVQKEQACGNPQSVQVSDIPEQ